jgi:CYTH domain-containing protein
MGVELERRFLVRERPLLDSLEGTPIIQGYLAKERGEMSTRVRISGKNAWLTLKSPRKGFSRAEFEYPIPLPDAQILIEQHCGKRVIRKTRYRVPFRHLVFEVDLFAGPLTGLVIAELELDNLLQLISSPLPAWIGQEVTHDSRYGNRTLAEYGLPPAIPANVCTEVPFSALST